MKTTFFFTLFYVTTISFCSVILGNQEDTSPSVHPTVLDLLEHTEQRYYIPCTIRQNKEALRDISQTITNSPAFTTYQNLLSFPSERRLSKEEIDKKNQAYTTLIGMLRNLIENYALEKDENAFNDTYSGYLLLFFK